MSADLLKCVQSAQHALSSFSVISIFSATPYDELWAIDEADRLRHLSTIIYCPIVAEAQHQHDDKYIDDDFSFPENVEKDWEFL